MEQNTKNSGQGLGVAALVMGIISFIVAFIPCVGLFALFTSIIAIVLGAIGLSQASRNDSPKGLMLGGLIVGVIALFISIAQIVILAGIADKAPYFEEKIEDVLQELEENVFDEIEDGNFSITIDDGDETIEINSSVKKNLRDKLEELEGDDTTIDISVKIDTSGGE